jgi:hypothetical protein
MLKERRELKAERKLAAKERKAAIARGEIFPDEAGEIEGEEMVETEAEELPVEASQT